MKDYTYNDFHKDLQHLNISKPDSIVAIARGGLTLAHHLAEIFDIREVFAINAISYDKTQKKENLHIFNIPDLQNFKNVLVVDDISDSGDTFIEVLKILKQKYPTINFKTLSIFYKPTSKFKPDFYFHETNEWIRFFWERY